MLNENSQPQTEDSEMSLYESFNSQCDFVCSTRYENEYEQNDETFDRTQDLNQTKP